MRIWASGWTGTQNVARWAVLLVGVICPLAAAAQSASAAEASIDTQAVRQQSGTEQIDSHKGQLPESALPGARAALADGRTVEDVRVSAVGGAPKRTQYLERIPLKAGDRLERRNVRKCLRVLFDTGRFAEVEADATVLPSGGVAVEFRTKPNYFNGNVTVTGLPKVGPSETQVINTGRLELGALFTQEKLQDSESRILRLLHDNGYWKAEVGAALHRHEQAQQVDVEFQVKAGAAANVGKLTVKGDPTLTAEEAAEICKMRPGTRVRGDLLQRAVTRLRKRYTKQRRFKAQLINAVPVYHPETNTVDFSFEVDRGPVLDVRAEGMKLSSGKLKRLVPVYEENAVDEDLLNEGRRNLRDYLQGQGYFDATVQVRQEEDKQHDRLHIVYSIARGEQHRLRVIEIKGNKLFSAEELKERMGMQASSMLLPHGHYSQAILANDLQSIKNLYLSNGYQSVKVTSEVLGNDQGARGDMKVVINVDEGRLVRVGKLDIRGTNAVSEDVIREMINTHSGQPFSEATVADDRELVMNYYFDRGFPSVQLESSAKYSDEAHVQMDVEYAIHEGLQEFVDRVMVSGVEHTKPHIVNRAVAIQEGAPLSQSKMLQTQRNLYDLGIFNEVKTAIENPEGDEKAKDVLFQIKEAKRWTFNYGLGLEIGTGLNTTQGGSPQGQTGVSPRVTFDVTRVNFRGRDQALIFKSHFGNLQKRASLSFDQPRWFDLPNWRLTLTGLYDNTRDINTFSSDRLEGSIQLTQKATKASQILYRFAYRRVKVDPNSFPSGFSPDLIPIYSRPVRVGMPSLTYLRDTRDDPLNSTKGTYNTGDIGVASGYFGSEANFGRLLLQNATYHKFRKNWVFARSLRVGVETPYGSLCQNVLPTNGICPSSVAATGYVPLPERFFVGGSNSHRGFAINQAGPRDPSSGAPLGGNAMIVNNMELRLPPAPLPFVGDNLSFVLFHDMGNAFGTANEMWKNLWRFSQRKQQSCRDLSAAGTCDFSYMSQSIGTGVRYRTPIGPVRMDVGYNLNPPVFPVKDPCNGITSGCTAVPHVEQVRHFNFYFSIGQTF
ncbi:MAG TPA: outer membrane protein assembly factor BamA [Candidatus Saccharimonadales bacterium]|nr:outer membrane protein assembly factor BamA [Candidatus Saccharimonadales bacterium]